MDSSLIFYNFFEIYESCVLFVIYKKTRTVGEIITRFTEKHCYKLQYFFKKKPTDNYY